MTSSSLKWSLSTSSIARRKVSARTDTSSGEGPARRAVSEHVREDGEDREEQHDGEDEPARRREPLREAEYDRIRLAERPLPTASLGGDLVFVVGEKDLRRPPKVHVPHAAHFVGVEGVNRFLRQLFQSVGMRSLRPGPFSRGFLTISQRRGFSRRLAEPSVSENRTGARRAAPRRTSNRPTKRQAPSGAPARSAARRTTAGSGFPAPASSAPDTASTRPRSPCASRIRPASGRFVFVATVLPDADRASSTSAAAPRGSADPVERFSKNRTYAASISATVRSCMYASRSASVPFP